MDEREKTENSTNKQRGEEERGLNNDVTLNFLLLLLLFKKKKKKEQCKKLVDNAREFEKESLGPGAGANIQTQMNIDWTTEMKMKLVKMEDEERNKGTGFIRRVKERWNFSHHSLRIQYA